MFKVMLAPAPGYECASTHMKRQKLGWSSDTWQEGDQKNF